MTGGPAKEHGTNKPPPTRGIWERSKRDTTCLTTSQNPSLWHPSWLNKACTTRKDSESEWLAKDNLESNTITIKPETVSHMAERIFWVSLFYCSLPGDTCPIKSLGLSVHVSPQTIHFRVLDKSPVLGPGRGPPSCNMRTETLFDVCPISVLEMKLCNYLLLVTDGIGILCLNAVGSSKNPVREEIWHAWNEWCLLGPFDGNRKLSSFNSLTLTWDNLLFWGNRLLLRCTFTWKN